MTIVIFLLVLLVLILVHEFGHFFAAKKLGVRVDEFGIGFPPKLFGKKYGETEYTVNALPFGGFVRIFGEDSTEESDSEQDKNRKFSEKPLRVQATIIVAGVFMNILLAWVLFSANFMIGMPSEASAVPEGVELQNSQLTAVQVLPESPAEKAGITAGDTFVSLSADGETVRDLDRGEFQNFVENHADEEIIATYLRGEEERTVTFMPTTEIDGEAQDRPVFGVGLETIGTYTLPPHKALWEGLTRTLYWLKEIPIALGGFFVEVVTGRANFDQVAGPVGIVSLVGDASALGIVYLLNFVAIISLHLAVINIVPFPALDGGRLFFLVIEAVKGSPINPKIANTVNLIGFGLLLILMIAVTYNDILRIFG